MRGFFQETNEQVPGRVCICHGKESVTGGAAPGPGAVAEGAIEKIVRLEEELETLADQSGDNATREEIVLASVGRADQGGLAPQV